MKANNDRNVFCVENIDCLPLSVDLEVSCPTLKNNIQIKNVYVGRGDKKIRKLEGNITQDSNSCFKYKIRPFLPEMLIKNEEIKEEEIKDTIG